jgi:hypothetical protein
MRSDVHTQTQKFVQALFDSIPVTSFVLILVIAHVILMGLAVENKAFEAFTTVFFILELSTRIWAHKVGRYLFYYYNAATIIFVCG